MAKLVTIYGGSGFLGRYIARRMAKEGWRVRVAVRRPNEAIFVKPYGAVGQVVPVLCNIRDDASVQAAMVGADAVINCVGLLAETGKNKFDAVQHEGAERIARLAADLGIETMVHVSAIGADAESDSEYSQSKALGEAGVLQHMPNAMILRPSILFGQEDQFFNRFAAIARLSIIVPVVGGDSRFQPAFVDDVAQAAVMGATGQAPGGIYELGGPDIQTMRELMETMCDVIQRRRLILNIPMFAARIKAFFFELGNTISFGLAPVPFTRDQVRNLAKDNVVGDVSGFETLGITPTSMAAVLPDYLWCFRPSGQYAAIKNSAKNLRT